MRSPSAFQSTDFRSKCPRKRLCLLKRSQPAECKELRNGGVALGGLNLDAIGDLMLCSATLVSESYRATNVNQYVRHVLC